MKPATIDELRTMEAHIEAGAVGGNPTWLLFLVIWLQATSGIDFDDINRSQPVELHFLKTLAKINPQEANPEDADLLLQQTPVQAGQGTERTDDFVSEQPTSHWGLNDTNTCTTYAADQF